jgi:23S rRNA G2069 N7-methylase RlmK/C1962 C5-methylase RlmI
MATSRNRAQQPAPGSPDVAGNPLDMTDAEFEARALDSLRHYRETGLHLTHEEVREWMRQRASGKRIPAPKLHS